MSRYYRTLLNPPPPPTPLLDDYSGAEVAYSLRYLSSSFSSDVILVRRSSDNSEQGFTPTEISDGTLESFCGVGDGFVKTWYDQSGNSNNATQTTASKQPQLVDAGSLIIENGLPALQAVDGTTVLVTTLGIGSPIWGFSVLTGGSGTSNKGILGQWGNTQTDWVVLSDYFTGNNDYGATSIDTSGTRTDLDGTFNIVSGTQYLTSFAFDGTIQLYVNGSLSDESGTIVDVRNGDHIRLYAYSATATADPDSKFQEVILYNSDQSSNRSAIETDINNHYSIY